MLHRDDMGTIFPQSLPTASVRCMNSSGMEDGKGFCGRGEGASKL